MKTLLFAAQAVSALAATFSLAAQGAVAPQSPVPADDWLTPIHTLADDAERGAYGLWAAGSDYKVSFGDGFTFYPVLGESYPENLPLSWRTQRIAVGEQTLVDAATPVQASYTDWRYELRYPAVTEAYDVRADGVEQTFVLAHRLAGGGDLVVTGAIESRLRAVMGPAAHQSLAFADAQGTALVQYGEAFAIDAAGRKLNLTTAFDGSVIELRVPAAWLAAASYPVTVDPLTSRSTIAGGASGVPRSVNVARDDTNNQMMVVYTRATSASDYDARGRLRNDDWSGVGLAFSDLTANWSTPYASVAFVAGSARWIIAAQRVTAVLGSGIVVYQHDANDASTNSGTTINMPRPGGFHDSRPCVAGTITQSPGAAGYLVFQRDAALANTSGSRVLGALVLVNPASFGTLRNLHTAGPSNYDADWPSLTANNGTGVSWVAVWQERNNSVGGDDYDVIAQRVRGDGTLAGQQALATSIDGSLHKIRPQVDGRAGRFAVTFMTADNTGPEVGDLARGVWVQRFDWSELSGIPVQHDVQPIVELPLHLMGTLDASRAIAYDTNTDSHWTIAYRSLASLRIVRVGFQGLIVEEAMVHDGVGGGATGAGLCFDDDVGAAAIAFGTAEGTNVVYGARFGHRDAAVVPYGRSCVGQLEATNAGPAELPFAGSEFFTLQLTGGRPNAPTVLVLGFGSGNFVLDGGCSFLLDGGLPTYAIAARLSDAAGRIEVRVPLYEVVIDGDLYWQVLQLGAGNQILTSNGLRTEVR